MERPVFATQAQAVETLWHFMVRMGALVTWLVIALLHLALAVIALALLWVLQVQPTEIAATLRAWSNSSALGVASALGASLLTVGWGYWRLARLAHGSVGRGPIYRYLSKGLRRT